MGNYGQAAVRAKKILLQSGLSPAQAWKAAIAQFTSSNQSRSKFCPREAFIGLCAAGVITDISGDTDRGGKQTKNRQYAIAAWKLLQSQPNLDKKSLWASIPGAPTQENGQMDVVISLWKDQQREPQ
jgi:hypothetical protein